MDLRGVGRITLLSIVGIIAVKLESRFDTPGSGRYALALQPTALAQASRLCPT
jgi:hypothetical protein